MRRCLSCCRGREAAGRSRWHEWSGYIKGGAVFLGTVPIPAPLVFRKTSTASGDQRSLVGEEDAESAGLAVEVFEIGGQARRMVGRAWLWAGV